jgi:hypothetical protein
MGTLILVTQSADDSQQRALNDLGDRIYGLADKRSKRFYFVRTNSGQAMDTTSSLQACMRDSSFDMGHTQVRILLDDKSPESYAGLMILFEEIFKKDPEAIIVLVHDTEFCLGLNSHLLGLSPAVLFEWKVGRGVAIKYEGCYRQATSWI